MIIARVMVTSKFSSPRRMVRVTSVPAGPRMRLRTRSPGMPAMSSPSIPTTRSLGCRPAPAAGDPRMGLMMTTKSPVMSTQAPIPSYSPSRASLAWVNSSGLMKEVCRSSRASSMPLIAPRIRARSSTGWSTNCSWMISQVSQNGANKFWYSAGVFPSASTFGHSGHSRGATRMGEPSSPSGGMITSGHGGQLIGPLTGTAGAVKPGMR